MFLIVWAFSVKTNIIFIFSLLTQGENPEKRMCVHFRLYRVQHVSGAIRVCNSTDYLITSSHILIYPLVLKLVCFSWLKFYLFENEQKIYFDKVLVIPCGQLIIIKVFFDLKIWLFS